MRLESASGLRGSDAVHRVLDAELVAARGRGIARPQVVDVGGGSGGWAVPLAVAGCAVTVVEPNPNALATLQQRVQEEGVGDRITVIADDVEALSSSVPDGSADLVLAHGLLEVVDDPSAALSALAAAVTVDGAVSVLVANRQAAVLHRALAGRLSDARRLLADPRGVLPSDGELLRRFDPDGLAELVARAGLRAELLQGDGVVSDAVADPGDGQLAAFELAAAETSPLREIAARLHVLARRHGP